MSLLSPTSPSARFWATSRTTDAVDSLHGKLYVIGIDLVLVELQRHLLVFSRFPTCHSDHNRLPEGAQAANEHVMKCVPADTDVHEIWSQLQRTLSRQRGNELTLEGLNVRLYREDSKAGFTIERVKSTTCLFRSHG